MSKIAKKIRREWILRWRDAAVAAGDSERFEAHLTSASAQEILA